MKKITKDLLAIALHGVSAAVSKAEEIVAAEIPEIEEGLADAETEDNQEDCLSGNTENARSGDNL